MDGRLDAVVEVELGEDAGDVVGDRVGADVEFAGDLLIAVAAREAREDFKFPDVPDRVRGDRGRLRQILLNLISNAVKFTSEDDQAARLFDSFFQADQSTTRRYGGTGLGLAISRELVHRMGGEIGAEPGEQSGSLFWFTANLPATAAADAAPQIGPRPQAKVRPQPGGPRVLIVEDNEVNHAVAKALLIKQGLRSSIAHNGREAVEMAFSSDYAVILMDCQMPELDGYEATRQIRAAEGARHVPIIALTAHSMPGDRERCLAAGMDDYLSKPVRPQQLESAINRWLPGHAPATDCPTVANGAAPAVANGSAPASDEVAVDAEEDPLVDPRTIDQLKDSLTLEMRASLMETFETALPKCVADILGAVERGDQTELRRAAHLLKGSAATLGARRLREACQRLEHTGRDRDPGIDQAQLDGLALTVAETRNALREKLLAG